MSDGWEESASAWIAEVGERGDFGREHVLDGPMLARVAARRFAAALDVGCGEGRFCRMLRQRGIASIGIDPTESLIRRARLLDAEGDYRIGRAESLEFPDATFDLVVSYLTLIDIADSASAIREMVRVLRPGGTLLIANLTSFTTASVGDGWMDDGEGGRVFAIDHYLTERAEWAQWRGIRVYNWHRPLSRYMSLLIAQGLLLRYFSEPEPTGGDPSKVARYRRVPYFVVMEWERPAELSRPQRSGDRIPIDDDAGRQCIRADEVE
jgi:SAM-dependent methyltransferase